MDVDQAKRTLLRHAEGGPSETPDTLLTSLRPFRGIQDQHFREILHALVVLAPELNGPDRVDRQLVHTIWDLCRTARAWTRGPREPMFHGPRFIEPAEKKRLDEWLDNIECITLSLLRGRQAWSAFLRLSWYVLQYRWGAKAAFLIEVFLVALRELHKGETWKSVDDEVMLCDVFGAMGEEARSVIPALEQLRATTQFDAVRAAAARALESIDDEGEAGRRQV